MMKDRSRSRVVAGHLTRVEVCDCGGVVITIGSVCLRLSNESAADMASTLAMAIYGNRTGGNSGEPPELRFNSGTNKGGPN